MGKQVQTQLIKTNRQKKRVVEMSHISPCRKLLGLGANELSEALGPLESSTITIPSYS